MSDAAARLLALAYIRGWYEGQLVLPPADRVIEYLFSTHKTVVTQHWANELLQDFHSGL